MIRSSKRCHAIARKPATIGVAKDVPCIVSTSPLVPLRTMIFPSATVSTPLPQLLYSVSDPSALMAPTPQIPDHKGSVSAGSSVDSFPIAATTMTPREMARAMAQRRSSLYSG